MNLTHGSLFTGYGGFDLAADWVGWATAFQCEINPYCRRLLQKNFAGQGIELVKDIRKFNATKYNGTVDVISGGDPCQPHSLQGARKGQADDRYLWPQYLRIVNEVQPLWVVNENVRGSISNGVLDSKISDLEAAGYTCWPSIVIPASSTGTVHRRERVLLVAHAHERRWRQVNMYTFRNKKVERKISGQYRIPDAPGITYWDTNCSKLLREVNGTAEKLAPTERYGSIQAAGNGIVPQLAFGFFQEIDRITTNYFNQGYPQG